VDQRRDKAKLSLRTRAREASLGQRLIERDGIAVRLTEDCRTLHARGDSLLAELTDAVVALTHSTGPPCGCLPAL
jgi:DNA-binding transcriptional LysR family regulator